MATQQHNHETTPKSKKAAVRRLLTAMDRLVVAAKQVERARDEVERKTEGRRDD